MTDSSKSSNLPYPPWNKHIPPNGNNKKNITNDSKIPPKEGIWTPSQEGTYPIPIPSMYGIHIDIWLISMSKNSGNIRNPMDAMLLARQPGHQPNTPRVNTCSAPPVLSLESSFNQSGTSDWAVFFFAQINRFGTWHNLGGLNPSKKTSSKIGALPQIGILTKNVFQTSFNIERSQMGRMYWLFTYTRETNGEKWPHLEGNVGKYSLHGASGYVYTIIYIYIYRYIYKYIYTDFGKMWCLSNF